MFRHKYFIHFIIIVSFFSDPYIWFKAFTQDYRLLNIILIAISVLFLINKKVTWGKKDRVWFGSFLLVFLFLFFHGACLGDKTEMIQSTGYLLKVLFIFVVVYFIKTNGPRLLNLLFEYNLVMIGAGIVLFFLLIVGIRLPYILFHQGTVGTLLDKNWLYPLGVVNGQVHIGRLIFTRVTGLTDEPGQLALLITWLLILNELTIKSVKYRKYLLIGGIFTFSLGYFFSIILFANYFILDKKYRFKVIRYSVISLAIIIFVFLLLPEPVKSVVYTRTVYRLTETKHEGDKKFEGDNRSNAIAGYYADVKKHDRLLFGYGFTEAQNRGNPRMFAEYGFLGLMFVYFPVFVLLFSPKIGNRDKLLILIIIINFIQRPGLHFIFQMLVLTFIYYWPNIKSHQSYNRFSYNVSAD